MSGAGCVLFDLDGTLYDSQDYSRRLDEEVARYVSEQMSTDFEDARALLEERRKKLGTLTRSLESLGIDRGRFFEVMSTRVEPANYLGPDPAIQSTISRLKEYGFKVALVSNSGRPLVEKVLNALHVDIAVFDGTVTSSEAPPKPNPDSFLFALKLLNCRVGSAVYVGDRDEAELRPAKELGIRTVLLDRTGKSSSRWADVVVGSLTEVPDIIRGLLSG